MSHKVLISLDDSLQSSRVVDYAVRISSVIQDMEYTLMNVQPPIPPFITDEAKKDSKAYQELARLKQRNETAANAVLEKCKTRMADRGVPESRIEFLTRPRRLGVAQDILDTAEKGMYDALLLGRRGLTKAQQLFIGSVSNKIINNASVIPVWIIDGEITSMKILVAVDGSSASLRAVDHLTYMVGGNPDVTITFLHVTPKLADYCSIDLGEEDGTQTLEAALLEEDAKCIDAFHAKAMSMIKEAGIAEDQVAFKTKTTTMGVAKAVREEARRGKYGTVVIGRKGQSNSFFMGSVSNKLIQMMTNCALWVTV